VKEAFSFLACDWLVGKHTRLNLYTDGVEQPKRFKSPEVAESVTKNDEFQLKIVAHYPRVFFLADESDEHSRALVLRG
jgi:hypothetical protein